MRAINDQIKDVAAGRMTAAQVVDEGVGSYAIDYFDFGAAGWQPTQQEWAAFSAIRAEYQSRQVLKRKQGKAAPEPAAIGRIQLWEDCERCGQQPSYITPTGHLCDRCYPIL
jgi:hypothetical protein